MFKYLILKYLITINITAAMKKRSFGQKVGAWLFFPQQYKSLLLTAMMLIIGLSAESTTVHKRNRLAPPPISISYTCKWVYSITINKNGSSDANLKGLIVTPGTALTATTGSADTNYATSVAASVTSVMVKPTLDDPGALVTVNGATVSSGTYSAPITVSAGSTLINLLVTAPDGVTTKTYSITVNKPTTGAVLRIFVPELVSNTNTAMVVHQAISPNGDGVNDHLVIEGINYHPDNKLTIMDSKGTLVYSKTGYDNNSNAFDGHSNNGAMQKPGVYFYSLQYKDGSQLMVKSGYIVLKY